MRLRVSKYGFPIPAGIVKHREAIEVTVMRAQWRSMIARCHDPRNRDYSRYGGSGIVVCERWRSSFNLFLQDNGVRPVGMSLHRIDPTGPYSPNNCKWATQKEQTRHRRNTIFVTYQGETLTLAELAQQIGVTYAQAYRYHRAGNTGDQIAASVRKKRDASLAVKA